MNAKKINGTAKNLLRLATPNTCEFVANGQMKFVASVMRSATDACSIKDDKYGHKRKHDENFTVN
jgi:hypothetical protein